MRTIARMSSVRRFLVPAALVTLAAAQVALAAPAAGRRTAPRDRERIQRVHKGKVSELLHIYWASPLSQSEVLVTPYLEPTTTGAEFEIVDQKGYVGRARVHHVEVIQGGCNDVRFHNGTATIQGGQGTQTVMVALPVSRRDLSRARVLMPEELLDAPRLEQRKYPDIGLDLDGNGVADLIRYYYDCPPPPGAKYSYGYCMDVLARDKGGAWKLHETVVVPECY